ncbi:MAG: hypothetical protein LBC35_04770 [Coriobacteriales bacterium]|jgi:hypothetical protein|nr:hypothetical protein [Coriobacteriales bacterium]
MATEEKEQVVLSAQLSEFANRSSGRIQAQVSSFKNGLQIYSKISIIRIRSRQANLLIMEDYMSIIGELDGDVDFIGKDFFHTLENVRGFYCHDRNVFFLLLKDSHAKQDDERSVREKVNTTTDATDETPWDNPDIVSGVPIASATKVERDAGRVVTNV